MLGTNLLGIYEKAFDAADDWNRRLSKAKSCGFDFLEISIDEDDKRLERLWWNRSQKAELLHAIWDNEMPILSMCLSGHRRYPFGSADPQKAQMAREIADRAIDFALELGIRTIQLAGYDVYYEDSTPETHQRFVDGLHYMVEQAARKEVMTAMEIMDTELINSISKYGWYKEKIPCPWFKVYPDIGNLTAWGNNVNKELREGIQDITGIHLKDTLAVTQSFKGKFKCVPFGSGCVDFAGLFATMEELHYCGPYMIEMWHQPGEDDLKIVRDAKEFVEKQYANRHLNRK